MSTVPGRKKPVRKYRTVRVVGSIRTGACDGSIWIVPRPAPLSATSASWKSVIDAMSSVWPVVPGKTTSIQLRRLSRLMSMPVPANGFASVAVGPTTVKFFVSAIPSLPRESFQSPPATVTTTAPVAQFRTALSLAKRYRKRLMPAVRSFCRSASESAPVVGSGVTDTTWPTRRPVAASATISMATGWSSLTSTPPMVSVKSLVGSKIDA